MANLKDAKSKRPTRRPEPQGFGTVQLLVDCRYSNQLPLPPVPKLLKALPSLERMCRYSLSAVEQEHRPLAPAKQAHAEDVEEKSEIARKRRRLDEPSEAFHRQAFGLQLPQLITNDVFTERQRFTTGLEAAEKKMSREPPGFGSPEQVAERIEATFRAAQEPPRHPSDPRLQARRVLPVVPDAVLWVNRYRQVAFDELPPAPARHDLLLRTAPDPRTTCFGYFSPAEGDSYRLVQNYVWDNVGSFNRAADCGEGEALVLSFPALGEPGEARFVLVPALMRLRKQKAQRLDLQPEARVLHVRHRDPTGEELRGPEGGL